MAAVSVLVLTGGPASGKTSTARALAATMDRCAVIDVDDLRHLVVSGHAAPWDGPDGLQQQELGVRNACTLAEAFARGGFHVIVADVLTPATEPLYRELLSDVVVVHLVIDLREAVARASAREVHLAHAEFAALHEAQVQSPPQADRRLDVTRMPPERQVAAVRGIWLAPAPRDGGPWGGSPR